MWKKKQECTQEYHMFDIEITIPCAHTLGACYRNIKLDMPTNLREIIILGNEFLIGEVQVKSKNKSAVDHPSNL
jgi:hypothetical protein